MNLKDKNIIVTGGARGIGKALGKQFSAAGAHVAIADLSEIEAKAVASTIGGIGILCDVTKENNIQKLVKTVESSFGEIDLFVSNAGICLGENDHAASASNAAWDLCWSIHVMAHVYAARAVLPSMIRRKKGYFLQIISAAALLSQIGDAAYSTTKHAALGFAESLAITHKSDGISVSVACPQYVSTEMIGYKEDKIRSTNSKIMTPEDLAMLIILGIEAEKFLILPHPEVYDFMNFKSKSYDKWINQMHELRQKALDKSGTLDIKTLHKFI